MIWVPSKQATRREVEKALQRAYPTKVIDELHVSILDSDLPSDRLRDLFNSIASTPQSKAVFEVDVGKAHVVHVGYEGVPDWEELNREFTSRERFVAIAESGGGILYWNILLSRIAPFWAGYWNFFQVKNDEVCPEIVAEDTGDVWTHVTFSVRSTLASYGLHEVSQALLDSPVTWLHPEPNSKPAGSTTHRLTVYDAIFSEVY
jgi:hypothetical protein